MKSRCLFAKCGHPEKAKRSPSSVSIKHSLTASHFERSAVNRALERDVYHTWSWGNNTMEPLPILLPMIFAAVWLGISVIFAFLGPWRDFAAKYPAGSLEVKPRYLCPLAWFFPGWRYNFGVRIGFSDAGVYVCTIPAVVMFHPPLFVPWCEITSKTTHHWGFRHGRELVLGGDREGLRVMLPQASEEEMKLNYDEQISNKTIEAPARSSASF